MCWFWEHKWKIIKQGNLVVADKPDRVPYGYYYYLQCKKCGDVKVKHL